MRIRHVRVHNFRSIKDLEIQCDSLMVLLGPNNHGKSNVLAAVEFALTTGAKPTEEDFFALRDKGDDTLWVELDFCELTEQERNTFNKYLRSDGSVKIRKEASLGENSGVTVGYHGYREDPSEWWLKSAAVEKLTKRKDVEKEAETIPQLRALIEKKGAIAKRRVEQFQADYIQEHREELAFSEALETSPLLGAKNVAGGVLPDFYLVPAVRELSDETKIKGTTTFGRLLQRAIQEMAARDERFIELRGKLDDLVNSLNVRQEGGDDRPAQLKEIEGAIGEELKSWGVKVAIEVTPPELEKIFELGTQLYIDDGLRTLAEDKGHGLQRAVIFALLRAWARALTSTSPDDLEPSARKASESVVFAVEEPELFLHPHAQRRLAAALHDIAGSPQHQVFLCTHSTHFVDLNRHRSIAIVSRETTAEGTRARQCATELFSGDGAKDQKDRFHMAAWINPDRGEMFFASRVVFVEGETEAVLLPFLANELGCFDSDVSCIDCGSKHNLPLYIKLAKAFGFPYCVIHDEDPLPDPIPDSWNEDKKKSKRRTFALNDELAAMVEQPLGRIEMIAPGFEAVAGVSKRQGEKRGKPLAALEHFKKQGADAIPARLRKLVKIAYGKGEAQRATDVEKGNER